MVRDTTVWTPSGPLAHRDVLLERGRIVAVREAAPTPIAGAAVVDVTGHTLLTGLVERTCTSTGSPSTG